MRTVSGTLVGVRELLVAHLYLADDVEVTPIGPDHENFTHGGWLENNVGDVQIMGNHHQIRGASIIQNAL